MQVENDKFKNKTQDNEGCLSPKELVNRHLQDKDHKISDEELQKIALDCNETNEVSGNSITSEATNNPVINDRDDENREEKEEKQIIITPLDVLG